MNIDLDIHGAFAHVRPFHAAPAKLEPTSIDHHVCGIGLSLIVVRCGTLELRLAHDHRGAVGGWWAPTAGDACGIATIERV